MKFYLAARYIRIDEINKYAADLRAIGHTVDCRWLNGSHQLHPGADKIDSAPSDNENTPIEAMPFAEDDIEDIIKSDVLILFTEKPFSDKGRGGRHTEFGYAIGLGKTVCIVGPRENVFHCLPQIQQFENWKQCLNYWATVKAIGLMGHIYHYDERKN